MRFGLRFSRGDATRLRALANRAQLGELGDQHVSLFRNAADAAWTGEPLIVMCVTPSEATVLADGFVRYGINRPAVEELTGDRPAK